MTLRTYIDHAIRDGAAFDAVICGCDVQQTFCWQPDMCITDACEAEYRPLLDAEIRVLAAAPGERFSSRSARTGSFSATPFRSARRATAARASTGGCSVPDKISSTRPGAVGSGAGVSIAAPRIPRKRTSAVQRGARGSKARLESDLAVFQLLCS